MILHTMALLGRGPMLSGVLALAGLASFLVVGLAVVALARRRSQSYLLITAALAVLLVRTLLGGLDLLRMIDPYLHHLLEHASDGVMAVLLLGAVYYARTVERSERDESREERTDTSDGWEDPANTREEPRESTSETGNAHE